MNKILNSKEIIKEENSQNIMLTNRNYLEITGVQKIESLNSSEFQISTILGDMIIEGTNLEMKHLDIEKGILWIDGNINKLEYIDIDIKPKKEKTIIGKLFK